MADSDTLGDPPPDPMLPPVKFKATSSSPFVSGGTTTGSTSAPTIPPSTTTGPITVSPPASPPKRSGSYQPDNLLLPQATTRKVLVAFLDESDEPVWAAKVLVEGVIIDGGNPSDPSDEPRMELRVSLRRYFDQ